MSFTHGEMSPRTGVVEYESYILGLALVIVGVINRRRDAESSVGSILDEWWSWVHVARGMIHDVLVCTGYYNWGRR